MNCHRFDQLVFDDTTSGMSSLEEHASRCDECREQLEEWKDLSRLASGLHESWDSPELWPRIQATIRNEPPSRRAPQWTVVSQWAAVALLAISLGVTLIRTLGPSRDVDTRGRIEEWLLRESAIAEVEKAEKAHIDSIERLSKLVGNVEEPTTPLEVSYREKLLLLDEAISECQAEIERNRYNAHLRNELLAVYDEKDKTLRQMLEEKR